MPNRLTNVRLPNTGTIWENSSVSTWKPSSFNSLLEKIVKLNYYQEEITDGEYKKEQAYFAIKCRTSLWPTLPTTRGRIIAVNVSLKCRSSSDHNKGYN